MEVSKECGSNFVGVDASELFQAIEDGSTVMEDILWFITDVDPIEIFSFELYIFELDDHVWDFWAFVNIFCEFNDDFGSFDELLDLEGDVLFIFCFG